MFKPLSLLCVPAYSHYATAAPQHPNIIYLLADDLGYGGVSCYDAASKIRTPHVDRLATEGMRFTDAHTPSAVCTPTRYGILTGRCAWRTRLKYRVLDEIDPAQESGPAGQLYHLQTDPSETKNVWSDHPDVVTELTELLNTVRRSD